MKGKWRDNWVDGVSRHENHGQRRNTRINKKSISLSKILKYQIRSQRSLPQSTLSSSSNADM
jgi:hypothetical protein